MKKVYQINEISLGEMVYTYLEFQRGREGESDRKIT